MLIGCSLLLALPSACRCHLGPHRLLDADQKRPQRFRLELDRMMQREISREELRPTQEMAKELGVSDVSRSASSACASRLRSRHAAIGPGCNRGRPRGALRSALAHSILSIENGDIV